MEFVVHVADPKDIDIDEYKDCETCMGHIERAKKEGRQIIVIVKGNEDLEGHILGTA